ncbi:hypothetical protein ACRS52_04785 [Bacillus cytotoxicus]|uniref:Uncharacterized protein n=1 Tax=Bacillus cytotoxicus TaxID=580165 RepID=A0AAX2CEY2_9BACI|nr:MULTISPECIES: hypothetical protein [Bacillus cereus group]AWC32288.1 hypothetical protein CG482_007540 [Bacillus cytotoxicus]AWC36318.1 hypothetical protein CG481_007550 [Bacillus cytotoxicus]AWC60566.1 hypothetical protein CG474_007615 [Bacillus cytotoxicus]KMT50774.1 hypothetical protein TU51_07235 [Bacillus cytotoxicus]QTR72374.1 hypothetical protein JC775_07390 [Bacillus cytotoxicus]
MQEVGEMTKNFISISLAEEPININSRYTFSLPLYTIGILCMELLNKGYLQLNHKEELEIIKEKTSNRGYVKHLMEYVKQKRGRTCKEWMHYFAEKTKITNDIFKSIVKEMKEEGTVRYHMKKSVMNVFSQTKIEYVTGTNSFVEHMKQDSLMEREDKLELMLLLCEYGGAERATLQRDKVYRFIQQMQEGILEGAQRKVLFV